MELQLLSLLSFSNLLIWVPGILFLIVVLFSLRTNEKGGSGRLHQVMLGLFIISMIIAVLVPRGEVNQALEFANAYEPGVEINSIADMSYATKDAYFRMSGEQAGAVASGDMFDFSQPGTESAPADGASPAEPATDISTIIYEPERGVAWFLLVLFLIMGVILFVQGPRVLGQGKAAHPAQ